MDGEKLTIYSDKDLHEVLDQRRAFGAEGDARYSDTIRRIVARYDEVCRQSLPQLSLGEWKLLCDVLNGVALDAARTVPWIRHEVSDAIHMDRLDHRWGVDGKALKERLAGFSYAELTAIVDVVERFWARSSEDGWCERVLAAAMEMGARRANGHTQTSAATDAAGR